MSWKNLFFHLFCPFCSFRTFFRDCAGRAKRKRSLHAPLTHVRTHTRTHLLSFHSLSLSSFIPYRSFSLNLKVRKKEFERASYGSLSLSLTPRHTCKLFYLSLSDDHTRKHAHTLTSFYFFLFFFFYYFQSFSWFDATIVFKKFFSSWRDLSLSGGGEIQPLQPKEITNKGLLSFFSKSEKVLLSLRRSKNNILKLKAEKRESLTSFDSVFIFVPNSTKARWGVCQTILLRSFRRFETQKEKKKTFLNVKKKKTEKKSKPFIFWSHRVKGEKTARAFGPKTKLCVMVVRSWKKVELWQYLSRLW